MLARRVRCGEAAAKVRAPQPLRITCAPARRADPVRPSRVCVCVQLCLLTLSSLAPSSGCVAVLPPAAGRVKPRRGPRGACGVRGACGTCVGVLCERLARDACRVATSAPAAVLRGRTAYMHPPARADGWQRERQRAPWQRGRLPLQAAPGERLRSNNRVARFQARAPALSRSAPLLPAASCLLSRTCSSSNGRRRETRCDTDWPAGQDRWASGACPRGSRAGARWWWIGVRASNAKSAEADEGAAAHCGLWRRGRGSGGGAFCHLCAPRRP